MTRAKLTKSRRPPDLMIVNGTLILPDRLVDDGVVCCTGGRITYVGKQKRRTGTCQILNADGGFVSPGFVDIHVHGGAGADFMDGTPEAVRAACGAHLRHGTTTLFPTTTTGSSERILAMIRSCAEVRTRTRSECAATIAGVHLYGPYFAEDKAGCHSIAGCRPPTADEYRQYFETRLIRIATCAAELPGAAEFYKAARRNRCLITCGHSNAGWSEMQAAFALGMRHVDHFWCAMSSVPSLRQRFNVPMQASMAEFVLMYPEMSTEVIADGCHLSPELLEFAFRMKGATRLCLVTDCNRALDLPPGEYMFGHPEEGTKFRSDGRVGWAPNGSLASAIVSMDHMIRHMKAGTTATLPEVIRMASLTPAERTGIARQTGSLQAGKRADIVILSPELMVRKVVARGYPMDQNE